MESNGIFTGFNGHIMVMKPSNIFKHGKLSESQLNSTFNFVSLHKLNQDVQELFGEITIVINVEKELR